MKTPDSRPRIQSATRHYHRYRPENQDGWNDWVGGKKKPAKSGRPGRWKWLLAVVGVIAIAGLLGVLFVKVL
jgi:hypothetical protein